MVFVLCTVLVDLLCFYGTLQVTTIFTPQESDMVKKLPKVDALVFGTSHAEQGFSPTTLKELTGLNWYNTGKARRNLFFQSTFTRHLIAEGHRPKLVVLVATYHDWNELSHPYMIYPLASSRERWDLYWEFNAQRDIWNPRRWFCMDQYSSTARMMFARGLSWLKNKKTDYPWHPIGDQGYVASNASVTPSPKPNTIATSPLNVLKSNLIAFESVVQQWRAVDVPIVIVDPPEFIGSRLHHGEYDKAWNMVEQICERHDVPCKSFSDPSKAWMQQGEYFRDGDWGYPNSHLNHQGTILFNVELAQWLTELKLVDATKLSRHPSTPSPSSHTSP